MCDVSAVTGFGCHHGGKVVRTHGVEKVTAAIHQNLVVGGFKQLIDILLPPKASHRLRAVDNVAQTEDGLGGRHFFVDESQRLPQFAFHSGRGMVHQEHIGAVAHDPLQDYCLTARLHLRKAKKTIPGCILLCAGFDYGRERLYFQPRRHGPRRRHGRTRQ